jgi:hypothetical protein
MAFNINDARAEMAFGGARPSLFQVQITNPVDPSGDLKLPFMCRSAQMPAFTVGTVPVSYMGRQIKVAGVRQFEPWTVTIYNDEDFIIRNAMEGWNNALNTLEGNLLNFSSASPTNYKSQATVTQYGKTGNILRVYQFKGLWPAAVSPIEMDWDQGDAIEQFQVTFNFDDFAVSGGITGNAGGI